MSPVQIPSFTSLALHGQAPPDWADVVVEPVPADRASTELDPAQWAHEIFSVQSVPVPVVALLGLRQALAPLIGVPRADTSTIFAVSERVGEEAVIVAPDRHLDFRAAVGIDREARLVRVTTAVWFHGWRGRLYFLPVRLLHDPVLRAMMRRAIRRAGRGTMAG
ncbi:MAG TPA: DUF2867 domain-containing protein [Lapillicoccus sp.]|nr:DUF2867 domain-containing protein [Lapillicoccus sp.]